MRESKMIGYFNDIEKHMKNIDDGYKVLNTRLTKDHKYLINLRLEVNAMLEILEIFKPISYPLIWLYQYAYVRVSKKYIKKLEENAKMLEKAVKEKK